MTSPQDSGDPDLPQVLYPPVVIPTLSKQPTAAEVVRVAIARSVLRYMEHAPKVARDENPEGVHQARVATRRLRSDLRTFRRFVDREWANQLRADLRTVTDLLGGVRDRDVMGMRFAVTIQQLADQQLEAARSIIGTLEAERQRALDEVIEAFQKPSYVVLLERLNEASISPPTRRSADQPARPVMTRLVQKPWQSLSRAVDELPEHPDAADLHRIRIRAKRARYAAEAVTSVCDPISALFAFRVSELQDVLGEHQDAAVAQTWLRSLKSSQSTAVSALINLEKSRTTWTVETWRLVWESIDHPGLTDWLEPRAPTR